MGTVLRSGLGIALGLALAWAPPAWADDDLPPPPPPDLGTPAPRAPGQPSASAPAAGAATRVPVPDVRGRDETDAIRRVAAAGLRIGGIERVSAQRLEAELGQRYALGIVVQQAPPPSAGTQPNWVARGTEVWLRVAAARDEGVVHVTTPMVPAQPTTPAVPQPPAPQPTTTWPSTPQPPTPQPTAPQPSYPSGTVPPRPPPPYLLEGSTTTTTPYVSPQPVPQPVTPTPQPYDTLPGPTTPVPTASDLALIGDIRSSVSLPCERRRGRWHVRGIGGGSFWFGDDKGSASWYAGADLGHTFSGCFGADLYYRYSAGKFDRTVTGGRLEDSGGWHHVGVKGTYMNSLSRTSPLFGWVGVGVGWFSSSSYVTDDTGFEGYGEVGIGYMAANNARLRLGVMFHAMDTSAARRDAANDGNSRLLWLVAPTLSVEVDL